MAESTIVNPAGINAPQGNEVYADVTIQRFVTDPAGNSLGGAIVSISAAAAAVVTTTSVHGLVNGQQVTMASATWTTVGAGVTNGTWPITVLSSTTFSIPVLTTGGTNTAVGTYTAPFVFGQLMGLQTWNGTASGAASAPAYPTVTVASPAAAGAASCIGPLIGGNTLGSKLTQVPGGTICQIATSGLAQVLFTLTPTAAQIVTTSATIPGGAISAAIASAAAGTGVGTCLQAPTATTIAPALGWCHIESS